ncbi:unnamed protein product [Lymnaea stagnalis]|uniref:C-type lectin domain-containing protein n=1 Tax=Lymnaea stagnalis TaxID=6523 RepID=A0AAV2HAJ7_LYMST
MEFLCSLFRLKFYLYILDLCHGSSPTDFNLVNFPRNGALRVGAPWRERCVTSCLVTCQLKDAGCRSAMYDPEKKMCIPGSQVSYGNNEVTPSFTTLLYVQGECNPNEGFFLYPHNSFVTCLFLSAEKINYVDAREKCRLKGSHLYTAKSQVKLDLFIHLVLNVFRGPTWIGLTDLDHEGTFVWEDGEMLNRSMKVWAKNQPDNWDIENCAGTNYYVNYSALNDLPCSDQYSYICEPYSWL